MFIIKSILSGIFPYNLKFSIIKPIYKKGDRMNPANYRPISLLNSFSKVFVKPLYARLSEHFYSSKLLVGNKFGFRKGIATEDAIFKLTNETLNNKIMPDSTFFDLEKAFGSVNHDILLSKLPYYGIIGNCKLLLKFYLQNRHQRVQIIDSYLTSNTVSEWTKIKNGALQHSIFGPLLFLVYINDLPKAIDHKDILILFANDTSILITSPNNNQVQNDLNIVFGQQNKWLRANLFSLNFDKTYIIQFTNKSTCTSNIPIIYKDKQIRTAIENKFLGLFINNNLSWKTHIENIKSKLSSACSAMRLVKPYLSINTLKMIYCSYFHSVMNYGLLFWLNSSDSIKIFRLQKKLLET